MKHYMLDKTDHNVWDLKPTATPKKWGSETTVTNGNYCVKVMEVKPDAWCSLHFHKEKTETFTVVTGVLVVELVDLANGDKTTIALAPHDSLTIEPFTPHRFYLPFGQEVPTFFIESSTKDSADDNYRITPSSGR